MAAAPTPSPSPAFLAETNHPFLGEHVSIAFIIIDTLFLGLCYASRYYNRYAVGTGMLVCNTLAYVFCMGSATTGILMARIGGAGHHVASVPLPVFETWLKLSKVLEFTYTPAVMFAKLATLLLYWRVFEIPLYRRLILCIGAVLILQGVISLILGFSICRPFRYFWTQAADKNDGHCGDVMLFYRAYSIPSLITDVVMLLLPLPILVKLNVKTAEKVGLILTFLAASLGIITCTLRFVTFFTTPLFSDPTWYASGGTSIYALVEPSIYMIASILPASRHLYGRVCARSGLFPGTFSGKSTGEGASAGAGASGTGGFEAARSEDRFGAKTGGGLQARELDEWGDKRGESQEELTPRGLDEVRVRRGDAGE